MKINMNQALAGLALFVIAYHLGKRKAAAAPGAAAADQTPATWWTYAGAWGG